MARKVIKFIDLFAGIGGIRLGLEQALKDAGYTPKCVFTSEIKPAALSVLKQNHPGEEICGDITQVKVKDIPKFDILCAGFPCQPSVTKFVCFALSADERDVKSTSHKNQCN